MYEPIPFGGREALDADELTPLGAAVVMSDCWTDDGTIVGRHGARSVTGASAIGSGTGQHVGRYRPGTASVTDARAVVARGGAVLRVTDPSGESAEDGAATSVATPFGGSDGVCGAQLGKYYYLISSAGVARRMKPDYTLESITAIAKPTGLSGGTASPTQQVFSSVASVAGSGGGAGVAANSPAGAYPSAGLNSSGWYGVESATTLGTVTATLTNAVDLSGCDWILLFVSPLDKTSEGEHPIEISLENSGSTIRQVIGTTTTAYRGGSGSPSAIYCNIAALDATLKADVKRMIFRATNPNGETGIAIYGYVAIPGKVGNGRLKYYLTYYNSSTGQESQLSDACEVTLTPFTLGKYPAVGAWEQDFYYAGVQGNPNPDARSGLVYNFRADATLPGPEADDIVPWAEVTITGIAVAFATADLIRLYRETEDGIRLVRAVTNPGTGNLTIRDTLGAKARSQAAYKAGGTPPASRALCAVGGRLLAGGDPSNPNRLSISSFLPFGQDTDPFPQFPSLPVIESDGHAFDISATASEAILWLGSGDNIAYIGTSEAMYFMPDLRPQSPVYQIARKGVMGKEAACWCENRLIWAAPDGVYVSANRGEPQELSQGVRRLYKTFAPDSSVVVCYQNRKLLVFKGTSFLRYDFVTERWSGPHAYAHSIVAAVAFRDPSGSKEELWLLDSSGFLNRWQESATSDRGTAIAAWVYSTGFAWNALKFKVRGILSDATGTVTLNIYKDMTSSPTRSETLASGEKERTFASDLWGYKMRVRLTAANTVICRRLLWWREAGSGHGG